MALATSNHPRRARPERSQYTATTIGKKPKRKRCEGNSTLRPCETRCQHEAEHAAGGFRRGVREIVKLGRGPAKRLDAGEVVDGSDEACTLPRVQEFEERRSQRREIRLPLVERHRPRVERRHV